MAALGGVASATPGNGNGNGASQSAAHSAAPATAPGQSKHDPAADPALTQPQPISTADANDSGANGQCPGGPYCSTRDGSPSGNGNGTGKATGKPCAGCVGKADNKNPKGQLPGGSDHNAGYECDRNHGIGRSNPAHTGCTSAPTTVTTCPSGQVMVNGTCTTPAVSSTGDECAAGQVMMNGACTGSDTKTCPAGESMSVLACVLGTSFTKKPVHKPAVVPVSVLGERVVRTPQVSATATSLPFTGVPTGELLLLAAAALTVGGGLTVAGRRKV